MHSLHTYYMCCYIILFYYVASIDGGSPNPDYEKQEFGFSAIRNERITEEHRKICYNQTVYDDTRLEATEYFGLTLEVQDLVAQGGPTTGYTEVDIEHAAIRIIDYDGKYYLHCAPSSCNCNGQEGPLISTV